MHQSIPILKEINERLKIFLKSSYTHFTKRDTGVFSHLSFPQSYEVVRITSIFPSFIQGNCYIIVVIEMNAVSSGSCLVTSMKNNKGRNKNAGNRSGITKFICS